MQRFNKTLSKRLPRQARAQQRNVRQGQAVTNAGFLVSSPVLSGTLVTPQTALNFTSVFAAVNVISTDIACLPFSTYVRTGPESRLPADDVFACRLLDSAPNDEQNAYRFRQALMGHVLLWGNGYAEIVRNGRGQPIGLFPLNPALVQPRRDDRDGKLFYLLSDTQKKILPENMIHVAGLGFDGLVGYSAIHMSRQDVGLGMAATEFGAAFFGNHAQPGGVLKTPRKLSSVARQNLRESIYQVHQGSRSAHHLMILEEGMDWQATTMPLDDAQFLATRAFQRVEIAAIYRLPPHKIGDYSQSHLANVEESNRDYTDTTLLGWALAWEAECDNKLLFQSERDRGIFWHHSFARLNRGNTAARTSYYNVMRNMGAFSADDIRASEGMNPIGASKGGDLYLVQGQYVPLEQVGKEPEPAPPPPAPEKKDLDHAKKELDHAKRSIADITAALARGAIRRGAVQEGRYNENHDEKGQFAEGDSGGGSSGGESSSSSVSPEDLARYGNHPDVLDQHQAHADEAKAINKDYNRQQKEVDRDHARDLKDLDRDHAKAVKQLQREQAKDHESTPEEKAQALSDLQKEHQDAREQLESDHADTKASLEAERLESLASADELHAENVAEVIGRLKDEEDDD